MMAKICVCNVLSGSAVDLLSDIFTYLGDRVSAGGGCESVVSARTRCRLVKFRECGELLAVWQEILSKAEMGCLQLLHKAITSL